MSAPERGAGHGTGRGPDRGGRRPSPYALLLALAAALTVLVLVVQYLADEPATDAGPASGTELAAYDRTGDRDLPEGERGEEAGLETEADPDAPVAAGEDDGPMPEYPRTVVHGRLVREDGGALPDGLSVWASLARPSPRIQALDFTPSRGPDNAVEGLTDRRLRLATRVRPDADGRFVMPDVPLGGAWLAVGDTFLYPGEPVLLPPEPGLGAADGDADFVVTLVRGARVVGRALDTSAEPLAGASVDMRSKIDAFFMFEANPMQIALDAVEADGAGRFELTQVPAGHRMSLTAKADGHEPATDDVPPLRPGETWTVELGLPAGARLAGHVVDEDGLPVADARVDLQPATLSMGDLDALGKLPESKVRTDEAGAFAFESMPSGGYRLVLASDGYRLNRTDVIEVGPAESVEGIELVAVAGLGVSGVVTDLSGAPLADARVHASRPPSMMDITANMERQLREWTTTDAEGRFQLAGYDEGAVQVRARAAGHAGAQVDVEAGDEDIVLRLEPKVAVSGIAITLQDAEPLAEYRVRLLPSGNILDFTRMFDMDQRLGSLPPPLDVRDPEGVFRFDEVPSGVYDLSLQAPGYARTVLEGVEVLPESGASGLVVLVPGEARLTGKVVSGRTGEPVRGAVVTTGRSDIMSVMSQRMTGSAREVLTDSEGHFEMVGLGSEPVTVTVRHDAHEDLGLGEQRLEEGEFRDLGLLTLSPGATLYGTLRDPRGAPLPSMTVFASTPSGSTFRRADSDSEGRWRIEGLGAGTYNVTRMDFSMDLAGDNPASYLEDIVYKTVTLETAEEKRVDLVAQVGGTTLEGRVSSTLGAESGAMIWAMAEDGPGGLRFGTSDEDGMYSISGLDPGRYLLQVLPSTDVVAGSGSQPLAPVSRTVVVGRGPVQRQDLHVPGGRLVGRVVEKRGGAGVEGVRVVLERTDEGLGGSRILELTGGRVAEVFTDATGGFTVGHLADGLYDVVAGGRNVLGLGEPRWSVTRVTGVAVAEGRDGLTLKVEVEPGGSVGGVVEDTRGQALSGVPVWARDDRTGRWTSLVSETTSGAGGRYEVPGLEPGPWTLAFGGRSKALTLSRPVNVLREQEATLDMVLQDGVEVWLDTSPRRAGEAVVQVVASWGSLPLELSSLESIVGGDRSTHRRRLGRLPPGAYDLVVAYDGEIVVQRTITLTDGSEPVTVTLESGG